MTTPDGRWRVEVHAGQRSPFHVRLDGQLVRKCLTLPEVQEVMRTRGGDYAALEA